MENNELKALENNLLNMRAKSRNARKIWEAARNADNNMTCGFNSQPNQLSAMDSAAYEMAAAARNAVQAQNKLDEYRALNYHNVGNKITEINAQLRDKKYVVLAAVCARLREEAV